MKRIHFRRKKSLDERIGQEISKEVKEARREWRHFIKFKDENYLLFTAFVILLAAGVIINTVYLINRDNNIDKHKTQAETFLVPDSSRVLTSQQTGTNVAETVKISSVTENDKTDQAFTLDPSETMLIMNISITNNSASSQHLIPVSQLYVRSDEGDHATLHASMYVSSPLSATDLKPGQTATGQISFNLPKRIAHPLLYIDTGWERTTPLVFDVLR